MTRRLHKIIAHWLATRPPPQGGYRRAWLRAGESEETVEELAVFRRSS